MMIESIENRVLLTATVTGTTLIVQLAFAEQAGVVYNYTVIKSGTGYHVTTDDGFDNTVLPVSGPITGILVTTGIKQLTPNGDVGADDVTINSNVTIPVTINTGLGDDMVFAGSGPTTALLGPNTLPPTGQFDDDNFIGGTGNDSVVGGNGNDFIFGGDGGDTLRGQLGNDTIDGEAGDDSLVGDDAGATGNDSLLGAEDDDTIEGDLGNDTIDGGIGRNVLSYAERSAAVLVIFGQTQSGQGQILAGATPGPSWSEADSIVDWDFISAVWGGSGNDSLDATMSTHVVELDGFAGNDSILGSDTSDAFTPNIGDLIDGGLGDDLIKAGQGDDTALGGLGNDNVDGGIGNDSIFGGTDNQDFSTVDGNDLLFGNDGNDTIDGETGDDLESGGLGNDVFEGGLDSYQIQGLAPGVTITSGADTFQGDAGLDTVDYSLRHNKVNVSIDGSPNDGDPADNAGLGEGDFLSTTIEKVIGGDNNDTLSSPSGTSAWLVGNGGNDCLVGGIGDDTLDGDNSDPSNPMNANVTGNDTLIGGLGADSLVGGPGRDTASYADHTAGVLVTIDAGVLDDGAPLEGDDVNSVEIVIGGTGNDTLVGTASNDCLIGSLGNDSLVGLDGNDTLVGGDANPNTTLVGNTGADVFDGGNGIDVADFSTIKSNLTITLDNVANDGISNGAQGANVMGNVEVVIGGAGSDTLVGSANNDCLVGNGGNDSLVGAAGDDTLVGLAGGDVILGGIGNDCLLGGDGQDVLLGADGNDSLLGGTGSDQMFGGVGVDWVSYNYETRPVRVSLDGIANDGPSGETDLVNADIENVEGGSGSDQLTGNNSPNQMAGGPGNDSIVALQGNDTLFGGGGSDTLNGGYNNDTLNGGPGGDRLIGGKGIADAADYSDQTVAVFISLDNTANDGAKKEFDNIDSTVEILIGGTGNDSLVGNDFDNTLIGNGGDDTLIGGYGADSLLGGTGNDLLVSSNRKLHNDLVNDILDGGAGTDSVVRDGSDSILNIP